MIGFCSLLEEQYSMHVHFDHIHMYISMHISMQDLFYIYFTVHCITVCANAVDGRIGICRDHAW